jgi:hypothetical protein
MSPDASNYFLLIYNQSTGELAVEEFGDSPELAAAEYGRRERSYGDRSEIEVVLVGADSLETIKKTHSHYFRPTPESLRSGIEESLTAR